MSDRARGRSTLAARLGLARDVARNLGAAGLLRVGVPWLIRRTYLVGARDLRAPLPDVPDVPGLAWAALTRADHAAVARLCHAIAEAELVRRWDAGLECEGGWLDGVLVYCRWEALGETYLPYLGRRLRPAPGDLVVVDKFANPVVRGRGISTVASARGLRRARDRGCLRSLGLAAWWNAPAARMAREASASHLVGTVGYWQLGVTRRYFATGQVRLAADGCVEVGPGSGRGGARWGI